MSDRVRSHFTSEELAVVLSHYDLGVIESVTEFKRGSRQSPKVGIVAAGGKFLLKRRAPEKRSLRRIAFAHAIQSYAADKGFPTARLIPTHRDASQLVQFGDNAYELFEFVPGEPYGATEAETHEAGRALALFHQVISDFVIPPDAPHGSYHDVNGVRTALNSVPSSISSHDSVVGQEADLDATIATLYDTYDRAAERVTEIASGRMATQIVHADWHPGNVLMRRDRVVAVLDFDSCRVAERVIDVANGLLHFSLISGGDPLNWPDHPDEARLAAFAAGYASVHSLDDIEQAVLPFLMIEAVIAESVLPIVQTGQFGVWPGYSFLRMVRRKSDWLAANSDRLIELMRAHA